LVRNSAAAKARQGKIPGEHSLSNPLSLLPTRFF